MNRWICEKCHTGNDDEKSRCGFCSHPKPVNGTVTDTVTDEMYKLTQTLHNIIERLSPLQKKKLYRYLEDNII